MKTMKHILLAILFLTITSTVLSNEKNKVKADTVRIKLENCLLEIATFDLKKNTLKQADIRAKLNQILGALENVEIKIPENGKRIIISYSSFTNGEEVDFKKLKLSTTSSLNKTIVIKDDKFLETDYGNFLLETEDENYLVRLHVEKLEDVKNVLATEFDSKISDADLEIPKTRKKTTAWLVENNSGSFNSFFIDEVPPLTLDQLELSAGVGTGWIHNQFVTGFNVRVGLAFANKGIMKRKFFADYEMLYDFSDAADPHKFDINGFLSLGYETNFSLDPNKASWYGISAGYLVNRGNQFFEKNTFKVAIHKQISNSIILKPEIYFSDFFTDVSPALRVQITF